MKIKAILFGAVLAAFSLPCFAQAQQNDKAKAGPVELENANQETGLFIVPEQSQMAEHGERGLYASALPKGTSIEDVAFTGASNTSVIYSYQPKNGPAVEFEIGCRYGKVLKGDSGLYIAHLFVYTEEDYFTKDMTGKASVMIKNVGAPNAIAEMIVNIELSYKDETANLVLLFNAAGKHQVIKTDSAIKEVQKSNSQD